MEINFDPFPVLQTSRLKLRRIEENDVNEIYFLRSDERLMKYLGRSPESSVETAALFIRNIQDQEKNGEGILWGITLHTNPTIIGTICYWHILKEHFRAEVGYLLHPDYQGKGYMDEAMEKVIDYGFNTMHLHSIEADADPQNSASIKLLVRNQFVKEALFKENYFYNGKFLDTVVYSLLKPT